MSENQNNSTPVPSRLSKQSLFIKLVRILVLVLGVVGIFVTSIVFANNLSSDGWDSIGGGIVWLLFGIPTTVISIILGIILLGKQQYARAIFILLIAMMVLSSLFVSSWVRDFSMKQNQNPIPGVQQ